ncbi:MAG: hypothetical protein L0Z55_10340 [Planctomycetes bacterium]|nr:hypothetical protein [Planctomycetota bacterium]
MPIGQFEREILLTLAAGGSPESYVGGATVLHLAPSSPRTSKDIAVFHDTDPIVEGCAAFDGAELRTRGYTVDVLPPQLGFVRAIVRRADQTTKLEWVRDSAFRFFPVERDPETGWRLNFWDAATNKLLAFAGRMKLRDYFDVMFLHREHLHVGALAWAAAGKDPGLTPELIIDWGGRHARLLDDSAEAEKIGARAPVDLQALRREWLVAADEARSLIARLPASEVGCFYLDAAGRPVCPDPAALGFATLTRHFGSMKGAWADIAGS